MTSHESMSDASRSEADRAGLRPDDIRNCAFPVVRRGYDRERVDRYLGKVAEAYAIVVDTGGSLRQRLKLLEADVTRAEEEAAASARAACATSSMPSGSSCRNRNACIRASCEALRKWRFNERVGRISDSVIRPASSRKKADYGFA